MSIYFLENKYTNTYYRIVSRAQTREKPNTYTEKHHIIPKSLGGSNSKDNLVVLTAREHFIVHKLLVKMTEGKIKKKMVYALYRFTCRNNKQNMISINSRDYEIIRKDFIENHQMKDSEVNQKVAKTQNMKYGNRWPSHTSGIKTSIQKYGVPYAFLLPEYNSVTKTNKEIHTCPNCGKTGKTRAAMKRWHFDNCKSISKVIAQ
jgi:ribosomal protein L37AE/L43A